MFSFQRPPDEFTSLSCSYVTYSKHRLLKFGTFTQYVWLLFISGEAGSEVAFLGESKWTLLFGEVFHITIVSKFKASEHSDRSIPFHAYHYYYY